MFGTGVYGALPSGPPAPEVLTNLAQLRHWADQELPAIHPFDIEADLLDMDSSRRVLILRDATGIEVVRLDPLSGGIHPGITLRLKGSGYLIRRKGFGLVAVPGLIVDNDGIHAARVRTGTVALAAGMHAFKLEWFNAPQVARLTLEIEGPDLPRQSVSRPMLYRPATPAETGTSNLVSGVNYRCYEGVWDFLPAFSELKPIKIGTASGFDIDVRSRNENVAIEFSGFIRIPRDGAYKFYLGSDDGSRFSLRDSSLEAQVVGDSLKEESADEIVLARLEEGVRRWLTVEGTVLSAGARGDGGELRMRVGTDDVRVDIFDGGDPVPKLLQNGRVRVSGIYRDLITGEGERVSGSLLAASWGAVRLIHEARLPSAGGSFDTQSRADSEAASPEGSSITTVAEIKSLPIEMARQFLPVKIRGVVTAAVPTRGGAVIQDSTRGIFVNLLNLNELDALQSGEFCEVEGFTGPGYFAPLINARRIVRLGVGEFPKPVRATWDQLMNGSLDTQWVEMNGVITGSDGRQVSLLTEGGKVFLHLSDFSPDVLRRYENAVVRILGCVFAPFNEQTRALDAGPVTVSGATIEVVQPPPPDLFSVSEKGIAEFLYYDAKAMPFRYVKVTGQVAFSRPGEFFLTDGTSGMHVTARNTNLFQIGDLVDAVGFPDIGGPIVELKEAIVRRKSVAPLSPAKQLTPEQLLFRGHGGTRVCVEAMLMDYWRDRSEYVLELQAGFLNFRARVSNADQPIAIPRAGSRIEVTGVYAPQGSRSGGRTLTGFEFLLNSPADIRVLATPPWWTPRRVLVLSSLLSALLCGALVWNKALRRQVQERTRTLELEIRHRERIEQQHAAEAERARIARDLHDDLGAGLTEVSLLASAGLDEFGVPEKGSDRFRVIAEKARGLVSGLDVIVWAVDPRRNSLQSFVDYVASYTKELLSASKLECRFRIPIECDPVTVPGPLRHSLFLAVKEALNNVIRHANATQVELQIELVPPNQLEIIISDDGRGFDPDTVARGNGLRNLHERLEAMGGQCRIEARPGYGTTVRLVVELPSDTQDQGRTAAAPPAISHD